MLIHAFLGNSELDTYLADGVAVFWIYIVDMGFFFILFTSVSGRTGINAQGLH